MQFIFGERSRHGCCSARPRAEQTAHINTKRLVDFMPPKSTARARLMVPEAGALLIQLHVPV
ncbi:MAG TPA: hypothetical protein VFW05_17220 [Verrucomicrobiae bacterium]|nr:hypothetical protein [Verrucomicrobiae bacterium]